MDFVFEISNLRVNYGFRCAVENLNLKLRKSGSLGLLGKNGAGKTSTVRALLGMIRPRQGHVALFQNKSSNIRNFERLGFAPEEALPPDYLTGQEYLSFVGAFRIGDKRVLKTAIAESLEWFELAPDKKIRDYSKGMRKRIVLAQAFLGAPELLILDEPLNGLDPLIIIKLRDRLEKFLGAGGSLLYSSHILAEVEKICSEIAILSDGKLISYSETRDLISEFGSVEAAFAAKVGAPK